MMQTDRSTGKGSPWLRESGFLGLRARPEKYYIMPREPATMLREGTTSGRVEDHGDDFHG
jgi:hypothetical protein